MINTDFSKKQPPFESAEEYSNHKHSKQPPFESAEEYYNHATNLSGAQRLGASPYKFTADQRPKIHKFSLAHNMPNWFKKDFANNSMRRAIAPGGPLNYNNKDGNYNKPRTAEFSFDDRASSKFQVTTASTNSANTTRQANNDNGSAGGINYSSTSSNNMANFSPGAPYAASVTSSGPFHGRSKQSLHAKPQNAPGTAPAGGNIVVSSSSSNSINRSPSPPNKLFYSEHHQHQQQTRHKSSPPPGKHYYNNQVNNNKMLMNI